MWLAITPYNSKNILDNNLSEEYAKPYLITLFNDSLSGYSNFNFKLILYYDNLKLNGD